MKIIVGRGIGDILFGCSEAYLRAKLGPPAKIWESDDGDHRLAYYDLRCAFWFRDDRLHWIRCANPELTVFGEKPYGRPPQLTLPFLRRHLAEEPEAEDYGDWESYMFPDSWVELRFEFNALSEVCFGHLFTDDDEPMWPDDGQGQGEVRPI